MGKNVYMSVRLTKEFHQAARRLARQQDRPLSQVVRELLGKWVAEQAQPTQALK